MMKLSTTLRIFPGLLLAVGLSLGLAACGGDNEGGADVASAGGGATTSSSPSTESTGSAQDAGLAYARCMRENGVQVEDPVDGKLAPIVGNIPKEKMDAASNKCKQYLPNGGELKGDDAGAIEQKRKLSQCMRENGVPNFPDPDEKGGITLDEKSGIDPKDAKFQAAEKACKSLQPTPPSGATTPGGPDGPGVVGPGGQR